MATLLDDIKNYLVNNPMFGVDPVGNVVRNAVQTYDAHKQAAWQGGRPDEQFQQAIIPTKENIALFMDKMINNLRYRNTNSPDVDLVSAYLKTRYPRRYEKSLPIYDRRGEGKVGGQFVIDGINRTWTNINSAANSVDEIYPDNIKQLIGVLAHEGEHAIQYKRPASGFTKKDFIPVEHGGTYVRLKPGYNEEDYIKYATQPVEKPAFKATETSRKSFNNFLDLVAPSGLYKDQVKALRDFLYKSEVVATQKNWATETDAGWDKFISGAAK